MWWEPELYRWQGILLVLEDAKADEAERCFARSLDIAAQQEAHSLRLRTSVDLARLWARGGAKMRAA